MIFKNRDELVKSLKKIGLSDKLIWLLFIRGLIEYNVGGERLIVQLIEIAEKTLLK